jgi:hypothetical protein
LSRRARDCATHGDRDRACCVLGQGGKIARIAGEHDGLGQVLANAATTASVAVIVAGRPVAVRSRAASRACGSVTSQTWQARSSRLAWKPRWVIPDVRYSANHPDTPSAIERLCPMQPQTELRSRRDLDPAT